MGPVEQSYVILCSKSEWVEDVMTGHLDENGCFDYVNLVHQVAIDFPRTRHRVIRCDENDQPIVVSSVQSIVSWWNIIEEDPNGPSLSSLCFHTQSCLGWLVERLHRSCPPNVALSDMGKDPMNMVYSARTRTDASTGDDTLAELCMHKKFRLMQTESERGLFAIPVEIALLNITWDFQPKTNMLSYVVSQDNTPGMSVRLCVAALITALARLSCKSAGHRRIA